MDNSSEPVVLALDGGSTKTDAVLVAGDGTLLGRSRVGPSNHQLVGIDGATDALGEAIAMAVDDALSRGRMAEPGFPIAPLGVYCLAGLDLAVDEARLAPAIEPWLNGRTVVVAAHEPVLLPRFDTVVVLPDAAVPLVTAP